MSIMILLRLARSPIADRDRGLLFATAQLTRTVQPGLPDLYVWDKIFGNPRSWLNWLFTLLPITLRSFHRRILIRSRTEGMEAKKRRKAKKDVCIAHKSFNHESVGQFCCCWCLTLMNHDNNLSTKAFFD